eukprot:m.71039 g.71039  ORF g.71039 m.71039 type:complete len:56 (+) comp14340_c0_seq1:236-403(+)
MTLLRTQSKDLNNSRNYYTFVLTTFEDAPSGTAESTTGRPALLSKNSFSLWKRAF